MNEAHSGAESAASLRPGLSVSAWAVVAAFGTYFCMYAFRKPFTAGTYSNLTLGGVDYFTVLVVTQTLGYTLSKFLGIKLVAEVKPHRRVALLLTLLAAAEIALLLFGLIPPPFNFVCLFLNGLPLGMVFGLVLGFLEGRRHTEALSAGLCTSFIVADGVTKSAGAYLLKKDVSESWMPFLAGLLFVPPLLGFVWMLTRIPAPSPRDVAARSERSPMNGAERWRLFWRYAAGLTLVLLVFLLVTILRSVRADFARQIWSSLEGAFDSDVFARSEIAVGLLVLLLNGSVVFISDNRRAFFTALLLAVGGTLLIGTALLGIQAQWLSPFAFMVLLGVGIYLPYIAVHTTIFERLIAMTRDQGNIAYLMSLADSFGYLGYVVVLLTRNRLGPTENFLPFFFGLNWIIAGACLVLLIPCWWYFATHPATRRPAVPEPPALLCEPAEGAT